MSERHAIAALAHPRAQWPTTVARWATSGAVPVELLTCLSSDELNAAVASGRRLSAVLLDGASNRVDEHLIAAIQGCGAVPIGVHALDVSTDWNRLGVSSVLQADFGRDDLVDMLDTVCGGDRPADRGTHGVTLSVAEKHGTVIAVCGSGGCGASVVSMALAQGLADRTSAPSSVVDDDADSRTLLIDGARRAHQAMYHHTGDVIPGLPDVLARVRRGTIHATELHEMTFGTTRGYRLLLGAPTLRESVAAGSRVVSETLITTARRNDVVVVDHDGDLPMGLISEVLSGIATLWVIVTEPGIKGLHESVRFTEEACNAGVPAKQVLVVCNRVRRRDPARFAFPIEFARITHGMGLDVAPVMVIPEVRLETVHRDVAMLPRSLSRPLANRARRLIDHTGGPRELPENQLIDAGAP
jgi:CO dehydrogenase nickel-insertion accessory protein CooC1